MRALIAISVLAGFGMFACGSSEKRQPIRHDVGDEDGSAESGAGRSTGGSASSGGGVSSGGSTSSGGAAVESGGTPSDASSGGSGDVDPGVDASLDGGSGGSSVDASIERGDAAVVLPPGIIADVPYTCESPFGHVSFPSYFYLENWEDHVLDQPGVATSQSSLSSSFGQQLVDSIDCDDGVVDGKCSDCDALWASGTLELTFDAAVLGELPSHVGFVWTDGGAGSNVTITGYDAADAVIYTQAVPGIGDNSIYGTVEEDRFFGIVAYGGVKRVVVVNSTGGVEIDHLQYGR